MTAKNLLWVPVLLAVIPVACVAQQGELAASTPVARPSAPGTTISRIPLKPAEDRSFHVGVGDVLSITVWEEPQLATKAVVRPDGFISMPLVDEIQVTGLTPEQIQTVVTDRVSRIVKHPRVSVVVQEIHSRVVYITGEVQHPGAYPLTDNISVMQLIVRSGGLTEFAHKSKIFVIRQNTQQKIAVNYDKVLKGRNVEENVALNPGDMVVIP